ncbi:MAG: valine--tRNA ligase [Candidatus Moranbacteria bacterium]|nr:valine--tRNA ligase [Candidatus Moranbacteria bacterium]
MNGQEIPKAYDAKDWEDKLYHAWEESGFFNPDKCIEAGVTKVDAVPFSIVLPPPNVTGTLHTGSACMLAIEDLIVRFKRMQGYRTLWLPGTDHAAIATQSKVEKIIFEEEGKTRHDLGREELLKRVETFAKASHDTIIHQTKKIGSSLDWSREAYTLDEKRNFAVRTAFKKMFDEAIIYRGERIVNWDPEMQTTVSDDEIDYVEKNSPFYYFQYGPFVIGTVRPETKFGDKYVVMHPDDERYKEYQHGQKIDLEWINGPITATIIKDTAGDMTFGSGVMTITPAHSRIDFEIAKRHGLDIEQIIDDQGKLLPIAKEFAGQGIKEARKKIVEKLKTKGLVVKVDEQYAHNIATNSRGGGVIEPQVKKQWWINVNKEFERAGKTVTLKSLMQDAVRSGKIKILPERFEKVYFHWIDNLRDWCISRQIWYGHRIPVWYKNEEIYCGIEAPEGDDWQQDPDTLDTWFSSGLWTFSTLGWPEHTEDLKTYHPTALLETGYDILFFWIARMILMTTYLLDTVPFKTVYLHGLVRDEQGHKMSKSLDNIIDPLDMIADYGADALRLALVIGSSPGNDVRVGDEKIISFRNFTNKLWNIGRYVQTQLTTSDSQPTIVPIPKSDADHWILKRLQDTAGEVTRLIENYQLSLAGEKLRDFTWTEFADWYVEIHKVEKNDTVLCFVFETLLKLWHPFMPYVTEALWGISGNNTKNLLMVEQWPSFAKASEGKPAVDGASSFQLVIGLIQEIRAIKAFYQIDPATKLSITVRGESQQSIQKNEAIFKRLARINEIHFSETLPPHTALAQCGSLQTFIELEGVIDFDAETKRLENEKSEKAKYIATLETKLSNKNFIERAKPDVVVAERLKLEEARKQLADFEHHLASLV